MKVIDKFSAPGHNQLVMEDKQPVDKVAVFELGKKTKIILLLIIAAAMAFLIFGSKGKKSEPSPESNVINEATSEVGQTMESTPTKKANLNKPEIQIDKTRQYTAVLQTTKGEIKIKLFADKTPITVNNFVYLARNNFYNNTIFHRVIKGFMIQGGDPKGDGTGGPGYSFEDEPFTGEYAQGAVAMANAGPNTNGSQFFIMHFDYDLPKDYVIFGQAVEGLDVVDAIASAPVKSSLTGESSQPVEPVAVETVEIIEE